MLPGKASGAAASPTDLELQPILTGQASPRRDSSKAARARQLLRDPVTRAALGNLGLILTWQVAALRSTYLVTGWQLYFQYLFGCLQVFLQYTPQSVESQASWRGPWRVWKRGLSRQVITLIPLWVEACNTYKAF